MNDPKGNIQNDFSKKGPYKMTSGNLEVRQFFVTGLKSNFSWLRGRVNFRLNLCDIIYRKNRTEQGLLLPVFGVIFPFFPGVLSNCI